MAAGGDLAREIERLRLDRPPGGARRPWRRRRWRRLGGLLALVVVAAAGAAVYLRLSTVSVRTAAVQRIDPVEAREVLTAGGYIVPHNKVDISSQMTGRVEALLVEEGDRVERGAVIARLDARDLRAQLAEAEAAARAAAARLAELVAGPRPQEVDAARAEVAQARATAEHAERRLSRLRSLHEGRVVARTELDQAEEEARVARARLRAAEERLELVELGARPEQIAAARAEVAEAEARAAYIAALVDKTIIRAPMAGTIVEKLVEPGETVTTGFIGDRGAKSALVSMADLTDLEVDADVNETDIGRLRLGQPAAVVPDAYPRRVYDAELTEIAPRADRQKGTIRVTVKILAPDGHLRPEMSAKVTFLREPLPEGARPAVLAPRAALTGRDGRTGVFVVRGDGTAAFTPVTVAAGETPAAGAPAAVPVGSEGLVEVAAGLVGGERVVLDPPAGLADGDTVEPLPAAGAGGP